MKRLSVLAVFLLLYVCLAPVFAAGAGATAIPDHLTLTWTSDPATTMTITWRTDTSVTTGLVQYQAGKMLSNKAKAQTAIAREFTTDLGTTRLFTATLTGLSAKKQYAYRVGDGTQWSDMHTFTTADPRMRAVKFLVFGDSQSSATDQAPYALWRTTVHNAYTANPDARFMVNVGDLVDTGQSSAHWNAWFAAAAGVIDTIPEMAVQGNHETYGLPGSAKPVYWVSQFALPQNGPAELKNQVYSYNYGTVHCVVLDSQQDEEGAIFAPQQSWLDADLAASKATWNFVFFHKTPYDIKAGRTNPGVKAAFCPTMEKHHVDMVFNGHDHGVARTFPIKDGAYMQKPSQGTIYYIAGRSGAKTYGDLQKKEWNTFFYDPQDQPNYLVVEVTGQTLTVKTVKQDGTLVDTFVLDKAKDSSSDSQPQPAAQAAPVGSGR